MKYKSQEIYITATGLLENIETTVSPFTYENVSHIFSSEIGRELLESGELHIDPLGISYKSELGEERSNFKIPDLSHQTKYLK